jgi:hypothetical protein
MNFEAFIITNGRSTLTYCLKSLTEQSIDRKFTVLRDMVWVDALNQCLELCHSDFYIRIDDDMFLHPHFFAYCSYIIEKASVKFGVRSFKLWEDWSNRPGGYIKLYKTAVAKKVGFKVNKLGKADKPFFATLRKTKYTHIKDASLVGLHACGNRKDQLRYRKL